MQQLSLPLDLPSDQPLNKAWFQKILTTLKVKQELAWPDNFGKSLRKWLIQQGHTPIKTLSLFSGGGGLDIAFHDAGFEIIQMVELEAKYVQTLQRNSLPGKWLSGAKPICIDIREYSPTFNFKIDFINNTNSQIPKNKYLIPYAFPTLNPKSVQLRQTLHIKNE